MSARLWCKGRAGIEIVQIVPLINRSTAECSLIKDTIKRFQHKHNTNLEDVNLTQFCKTKLFMQIQSVFDTTVFNIVFLFNSVLLDKYSLNYRSNLSLKYFHVQVLEDWRYTALVIDRLLFLVFISITILGTITILLNAPHIFEYVDQNKIIEDIINGKDGYPLRSVWNDLVIHI